MEYLLSDSTKIFALLWERFLPNRSTSHELWINECRLLAWRPRKRQLLRCNLCMLQLSIFQERYLPPAPRSTFQSIPLDREICTPLRKTYSLCYPLPSPSRTCETRCSACSNAWPGWWSQNGDQREQSQSAVAHYISIYVSTAQAEPSTTVLHSCIGTEVHRLP